MTRVDYIRVPGREWVPDPDRRFDTIELRDPLFRLIRRAQAAVLDDLPKGFALAEGDLQRQDKPVIPQRVIREALVNALMHRSYRSHSPVQIIRYANRLEIRNPGFSLKSPEHLGEPGSEPRNPRIAAVLHETRFAETKGSGIRVMRETMEQAGLTPPLFESDRGRTSLWPATSSTTSWAPTTWPGSPSSKTRAQLPTKPRPLSWPARPAPSTTPPTAP
jgi:ATP-dependent DNA helicase RecG